MEAHDVTLFRMKLRGQRHRSAPERLAMRLPILARVGGRIFLRLPWRSPLRRVLFRMAVRTTCEAQNRGDWELALLGYADDCELRNVDPGGSETGLFDELYRGRAGVRRFFAQWNEAWAQWHYEPSIELADLGDGRFLCLTHVVGQGRGSGIELRESVGILVEVEGGQIVRQRNWLGSWDAALSAAGLRT
jgi:hypothetical protein